MMEVIFVEEFVSIIMNNGMSVALVAYFIFKDYKFNMSISSILTEIKEVLSVLKEFHAKEVTEK